MQCDGYYLKVFEAATSAGLDVVTDADNYCYRSTSVYIPMDGGWLGFLGSGITGKAYVDNVTVRSYDGEDWNVEIEENFEVDASGYGSDQLVHDAAGNLTYDGLYAYVYDPWNRLARVRRAYRDANNLLHKTSVIGILTYDGLGRRVTKLVENSADWEWAYRYYYDGHRLIETRDGSNKPIWQKAVPPMTAAHPACLPGPLCEGVWGKAPLPPGGDRAKTR